MDYSESFTRSGKLSRAIEFSRNTSVFYLAYLFFLWVTFPVWNTILRGCRLSKKFSFQGHTYDYFMHNYNLAWGNERTIEVPIIKSFVDECQGRRILEVGNVLSHYFSIGHDILDKYEIQTGVMNQDIVDFQPDEKYDLIVSISTLEHVGWDEYPKNPEKVLLSVDNLKKCLTNGGKLVVTVPLGYNPELDSLIGEERFGFSKQYAFHRISRDKWVEASWDIVKKVKFDSPYLAANGLFIGVFES